LVARVAIPEKRQRTDKLVAQRQWVCLPIVVVGDDLLQEAAVREVLHVHRRGLGSRGLKPGVEAEVSHYEIHSAVPGEVASDDPVPPAIALLEPAHLELYQLALTGVVEDGDGHPFAYDNEIGTTVAVDILPDRIRYHPQVRQAR